MGRHPGWGAPGGGATEASRLVDMWQAIKQQNIKFDAVLSGYMGQAQHVLLAEHIIKDIKAENSDALILVDPVMGDNGALYIPEDRAQKIISRLIPLADIITPNVWELFYILQTKDPKLGTSLKNARSLSPETLITSAPEGEKIGAVLITPDSAYQLSHDRFHSVPHGGGDSLAALFLAHKLNGHSSIEAMEKSVGSIFSVMKAANETGSEELPLISAQDALSMAEPIKSRKI
jgi:pyridoxine kinase